MRPIIAVSGFGRCGSSLVMQMLAAGGMPVTGQAPAYEAYESSHGSFDRRRRWLIGQEGHAVKMLDPQRPQLAPPVGIDYRVIWLDRDTTEQAKSTLKFASTFADVITDIGAVARLAVSYSQDRPKALAAWERLTAHHLSLTFEDLLAQPAQCARLIGHFAGLDMTADRLAAMASTVRTRSAKCYRGFLEAELLLELDSASKGAA